MKQVIGKDSCSRIRKGRQWKNEYGIEGPVMALAKYMKPSGRMKRCKKKKA
jgi:hypothetical protein